MPEIKNKTEQVKVKVNKASEQEDEFMDLGRFINQMKTQNKALKKILENLNTEYNSNPNKY